MSVLDEAIQRIVDERVERILEEKIPEIVRALHLKEAEPQQDSHYVDAMEVARLLGRDLSTPENIRKATKHVYNLAARKLIPSIRISERNIKFDLTKVKEAIDAKAA